VAGTITQNLLAALLPAVSDLITNCKWAHVAKFVPELSRTAMKTT